MSSSVDRTRVLSIAGVPPEMGHRVLDLCAELLPSGFESVWFFPNGHEVTHPSVKRPYSPEAGDINLGSRPEAFVALTSHLAWESLCSHAASISLNLIRGRLLTMSNRAEQVELLLARLMTETDQRRTRIAAGLSGDEWVVDADAIGALRGVLSEPRMAVIGAGVIFLADRDLAGFG